MLSMRDVKLATHSLTSTHTQETQDGEETDQILTCLRCGDVGVETVSLCSRHSFVLFHICNEHAVCLPNDVSLFSLS